MDRNPHTRNWGRPIDFSGYPDADLDGRREPFALHADVSFDAGRAWFTYEQDAVLAHFLIRGEVPEIPDIENLADTGWSFRYVTHRRGRVSCSSTITFEVPEGGEKHVEPLLLYYCLLYGA